MGEQRRRGQISMAVDGANLNTSAVVRAWFNDANELSLAQLVSNAGGED